ncbi:chain length determinant protein tyrosine kinase EpsG [Duganella sp. CT11-25]|jgi:chain length determinant protein tyrosine kinase EpsG|uniref:chain length determinant protein tyrosine kinase EpsG n=1 Tax=unclassified Duganella TaxID=2636909 RepID=UPI0039B0FBFA
MTPTAQTAAAVPVTPAPNANRGGRDSSIGGLLLESGKITPENAERVLRTQKELGIRFGEAAIRLGLITEEDIQQVLARQFDYAYLQRGTGNFSEQLIAAYHPFGPQVETLRAIRSQLMLRWFARGRKSLAIVSINPEDGASLFVANLAVVFSQLGEHTLLVDGNLRTPKQQEMFGLQSGQGLSDVLAGRAGLDAIKKIDSFVDLSVLSSGTLPPNPQELLSRASFATFSEQLAARYDVVLYDVAAAANGADAMAIAARVGGVVLVVRNNQTAIADVAAFSDQLTNNGVEVIGTVLNDL